MTRIRFAFAVVAIALLLGAALLVRRSLQSFEVERRVRHRTVAERVFDEMERLLSDFVRREEARPPDHYRFSLPRRSEKGVAARSPLSELPSEPFVLGYFEVDPEGALHSPLRPRDPDEARRRGDFEPTAEREAAADAVLAVARALRDTRTARRPGTGREEPSQAPGSTVRTDARPPVENEEDLAARASLQAYDALRSLNRGASERAERTRQPLPAARAVPSRSVASEEATRLRPAEAWRAGASGLAKLRAKGGAEPRVSAREEGGGGPSGVSLDEPLAAPAPRAADGPDAATLGVDPLLGRRVDEAHLVLIRTVWKGREAFRQGIVLQAAALAQALEAETLGRGGLPGAELRFDPGGADAAPAGLFVYRHRFAEPFDSLSVELRLPDLGAATGAEAVTALSLLLVAAGGLGLFALYRMVAVTVVFSERRQNFVAAVSHELKTPLTAIRMYGEMLRDGIVPDDAKRQEYYRTITAESERLSRLIDNVLEFSRLEKGTRDMHLVAAPLGPVVEEAIAWLRPHAERQGFRLDLELARDLPAVRFDRDALRQVLFNLVDNALKYGREVASPRIRVRCRRSGGDVALTVRDWGPGVPVRHLPRLFESFYRGGDELTRRTQGTGIGLALVKGLVEQMGARVSGRNAEGGGLEVRLVFPEAAAGPRSSARRRPA